MIFRRGDVATGPVVFERRRDPVYQFGDQPETRSETTDPAALRFRDNAADNTGVARVPSEVLAIGRVQNAYVDAPTPDLFDSALLERCWDRTNGVVTSAHSDVQWHYTNAWVLLNSARTQGAFGALQGKSIVAHDVSIETPNEHAAIIVTALDAQPIPNAERLLIAAVGRAQPNGVSDPANGGLMATPPCLMEPVTGTVTIRTPLNTVTALSSTGYALGPVPVQRDGNVLRFVLSSEPQVMYYKVQ
jgi:hypothetical protein